MRRACGRGQSKYIMYRKRKQSYKAVPKENIEGRIWRGRLHTFTVMSVKGNNFDFMCLFILKQKGHLLSFVIVNQHFGCYVDNEGKITITNKT